MYDPTPGGRKAPKDKPPKMAKVGVKPAKMVKPPRSNIAKVEKAAAKGSGRIGNLGDFAHPPKGRRKRT